MKVLLLLTEIGNGTGDCIIPESSFVNRDIIIKLCISPVCGDFKYALLLLSGATLPPPPLLVIWFWWRRLARRIVSSMCAVGSVSSHGDFEKSVHDGTPVENI